MCSRSLSSHTGQVKRVRHLYFHLQILKIHVNELRNAKTTPEKSAEKFVPVVLVLMDTRSAAQHAARAFNLPVYNLESLLAALDPDLHYLLYLTG